MAVPPVSPASTRKESVPSPAKRSKNPGIRVHGGRIYDPQNGKTCHQCRQKTMDFTAACKAVKGNKPCPIKFCHKCLLNRYGEKAEEVSAWVDWKCPKCRGLCNCSFCMKKKGHEPTGILVHRAKLTGFSSVHELLSNGGENAENVIKDAPSSPNKSPAPKGLVPLKRSRDKENCIIEKNGAVIMKVDGSMGKDSLAEKKQEKPSKRLKQMSQIESGGCDIAQGKDGLQTKLPGKAILPMAEVNKENLHGFTKGEKIVKAPKIRGRPLKIVTELVKEDVVRPPGKPLTVVAGVELPIEDVGHALQFLEFCNVFAKVIAIKKGEPEAIIRELVRGGVGLRRSRLTSAIIQFQIRLLSFILDDMGEESTLDTRGENSWLKVLGKILNESRVLSRVMPLEFVKDTSTYNNLDSSKKLRILALLCDEALGTETLRKFIDEENAKLAEEKKERMEHIFDAKKKEKLIKEKLKADFAQSMLSTNDVTQLSISEHTALISKMRSETEKAHQEMLETVKRLPKNKQTADAVRTTPLFLEEDGLIFWRLKCYNGRSRIVLQDMEKWSSIMPLDKWLIFEDEEHEVVEKYISSLRSQIAKREKDSLKIAQQGGVGIKHGSFDDSKNKICLVGVNGVQNAVE